MENKKEILKQAKKLLDPRIKTLEEVANWVDYLIVDELKDYDTNLLLKAFDKNITIRILKRILDFIEEFGVNQVLLSDFMSDLGQQYNTKRGNVMWPLRVAISGKKVALPLFESIDILGSEKVVNRIQIAIDKLETYNE